MIETIEIQDTFLAGLKEDILLRRIQSGLGRLEEHAFLFESFNPSLPGAARLIGYLAQWVDIGFREPALVKELLTRFPQRCRAMLPLCDYVHLRMAEGVVAMAEEEPDRAIAHFDIVLTLGSEIPDRELLAVTNYWKARCQRKKGEYELALAHTLRARDLALRSGYPRMAAVMRVLESWLLFQKGKPKEALAALDEAEAVIRTTDDTVTLGNIESTYGRIFRREGRYGQSIEHFAQAIDEYRKSSPEHTNLARTLANMAHVQRLVALQWRKKIDEDMARRRAGARVDGMNPQARERMESLRREAFDNLDQAARIYDKHSHYRGEGTVHLNRGYLYLDSGDLDLAAAEASAAYEMGGRKRDSILMSRGRILQCVVENAKLEEEVEEGADPREHAQAALDYAQDAVELAHHTENRRLLARAHTWHGLTLANEFFHSRDAARKAFEEAAAYVEPQNHDHVWEDFQVLKTRVLEGSSIDPTLLAWSQGAVGDKTFRQITDEFAGLVIPRVWEQEGRKVSRVATRLSISPKKVRRILKQAGLETGGVDEHGA